MDVNTYEESTASFVGRAQRDVDGNNIIDASTASNDQQTTRPQTQSSFVSTTTTEPIRFAERQTDTTNYLSYEPRATSAHHDDNQHEDANGGQTRQQQQQQQLTTIALTSLANRTNGHNSALDEAEDNSLMLLKLESTIERYHQRLHLLEQFVKVSTQKVSRLSTICLLVN